jgi:hypothetical protein
MDFLQESNLRLQFRYFELGERYPAQRRAAGPGRDRCSFAIRTYSTRTKQAEAGHASDSSHEVPSINPHVST